MNDGLRDRIIFIAKNTLDNPSTVAKLNTHTQLAEAIYNAIALYDHERTTATHTPPSRPIDPITWDPWKLEALVRERMPEATLKEHALAEHFYNLGYNHGMGHT